MQGCASASQLFGGVESFDVVPARIVAVAAAVCVTVRLTWLGWSFEESSGSRTANDMMRR